MDSRELTHDQHIAKLLERTEVIKELILLVIPPSNLDPLQASGSYMYRIARNTLRRNIMRLQAVVLLNGIDKTSDSALEITRNIIEDAVCLSYILSDKDPETFAREFFEYRWIQAKQDLDYYSKIPDYLGTDLDVTREKINSEYTRVLTEHTEFQNDDGSPRHSWTKQGIEGMMKELVKRKVYSKQEKRNILRAYQLGSRKTHFNPENILGFHDQETWDKAQVKSMEISIRGATAGFVSILTRYYDTVWHYKPSYPGRRLLIKANKLQEAINADL